MADLQHSRSESAPDSDRLTEDFLELFTRHQRSLVIYLSSLLPTQEAVDDVLQETSGVLWREFQNFEPGTNFRAWSFAVAFNQVRSWRKKQQRDRLLFSDEFIQSVSDEFVSEADHYDQRLQHLEKCVARLPDHHREIVKLRYMLQRRVEDLASVLGRTEDAVYRMLSRIRQTLHECIARAMTSGGRQ